MRRFAAGAAVVVLIGFAAGAVGSPRAVTWPCGISNASPVWVDYADATVPFWRQFAKPGLVTAAPPGTGVVAAGLREGGASVVLFDLKLGSRVGTPDAPADPSGLVEAANKVFDAAVKLTGCATPLIAENELNGAAEQAPWSAGNAQYHANVLAYLAQLAARGAHPYLLVPASPEQGDTSGDWWRAVAQVADIVREFFTSPPEVSARGPVVGSRTLRRQMRQAVTTFASIGVPESRLGLMLELESGVYGRNGLTPASAWFEFVKLEALAARQVAGELGLPTVWSWGWATYNVKSPFDADKQAAACVYLWTRDQRLCDGPAAAGAAFDSSLSEGQLVLPPGVFCTLGKAGLIASGTRDALSRVTRDPETAATIALGWVATRYEAKVMHTQIDIAERGVIEAVFGGSWTAYITALRRRGANRSLVRAALGAALRRAAVAAGLEVPSVSDASIAAFYAAAPDRRTRLVTTKLPATWLGGRTRGFAIEGYAPARLFTHGSGLRIVQTEKGAVEVSVLGPPRPLRAVPLEETRPTIAAALAERAKDEAYRAWLQAKEQVILNAAICADDDVPAAAPIELSAYLPFLRISA